MALLPSLKPIMIEKTQITLKLILKKKHATEYARVTQSKKNETGNIVDL